MSADNRADWCSMDILDTLAVMGEESLLSDLRWHRACIRAQLHLIRAVRAWRTACARKEEEPAAQEAEAARIYAPPSRGTGPHNFWKAYGRVKELTGYDKPVILRFMRAAGYQLVADMSDETLTDAMTQFVAEEEVSGEAGAV